MKKARLIKTNKPNNTKKVEDAYSVKKLSIIILILILVFAVFYFITVLVVKPATDGNDENSNLESDSSKITFNQLFNRKENEYYVLATKKSLTSIEILNTDYSQIYNKYIADYKQKEDSLPFYNIDLDDAFNKSYVGNELNISSNLDELKVNDETLFKIKNGSIDKYYVGNEEIIKALSEL